MIDQLTETWSVKNKQKQQQQRLKEKKLTREIRVFIRQRPRSSHGLYTGIFFSVLPFRSDVNDVFGTKKRRFPKTVPRLEFFFNVPAYLSGVDGRNNDTGYETAPACPVRNASVFPSF